MIIACPNCTKPYQLPDDQIAPLVQVQCAHCDYRVILDFEAANDPSLREPGMLLADGFRSEADYTKALADGHSVTKHDLPAKPAAARVPTSPPVAAQTTQTAASRPSPVPESKKRPKSGGLVSGLGLSDTPGSLAAAVTSLDKTAELEAAAQAEAAKAEAAAKEAAAKAEAAATETAAKAEATAKEAAAKAAAEAETAAVEASRRAKTTPEPVAETEAKPAEAKPTEAKPTEAKPEPVKDPEPTKAAVPPPTEDEEGKGSGLFWFILVALVILVFVVTYVKTGQFNPALLLQPGK